MSRQDDIPDKQHILQAANWLVAFPRKPVTDNHLLVISRNQDICSFEQLGDKEVSEFRMIVGLISDKYKSVKADFEGYNLLSNNGSEFVGQTLAPCHFHIFLRHRSESTSPFTALNEGVRWHEQGTSEWTIRLQYWRDLLKN